MTSIGTLEWARQTGGKLSWRNKLKMLQDLIAIQVQNQLWKYFKTSPQALNKVDFDAIQIPDSAIAQQALEFCAEASSLALFNHTQRTYYFACILAQQAEVKLDNEFLYVASTLHDIGLTEAYNTGSPNFQCFAVEGGQVAQDFVCEHGWSTAQGEKVNETVCLHLNLKIPSDYPEAQYMTMGTSLDVVGLRFQRVSAEHVSQILKLYPRHNFKEELIALMKPEYKNRPDSRISMLQKVANFNSLIRNAPFDE